MEKALLCMTSWLRQCKVWSWDLLFTPFFVSAVRFSEDVWLFWQQLHYKKAKRPHSLHSWNGEYPETITDWPKALGMKVNESKTECSIFYKNDTRPKTLIICEETEVTTSQTINVLGVTFDSKLSWGLQVANTISKATRTLKVWSL